MANEIQPEQADEKVEESSEEKEYLTFVSNGFKLKTGSEALENFKEKIDGKPNVEKKIRAWVQSKIRLIASSEPVKNGSFDKVTSCFIDHIFKEEITEAKKQRRLE